MTPTRAVIIRLAAVLQEGGHGAGTARALAANTVRSWAQTGRNYRGQDLRGKIKSLSEAAIADHEAARTSAQLSEADVAMARLELSGTRLTAEEQEKLGARYAHRATVAEGLLMAIETPRGREAAAEFLGVKDHLRQRLQAEVDDRWVAEAMGHGKHPLRALTSDKNRGQFHGMHGVQKAARKATFVSAPGSKTCSNCGAPVISDATVCPSCQQPLDANGNVQVIMTEAHEAGGSVIASTGAAAAARPAKKPAQRKGGRKGAAKTPAQAASSDFNQLHPRKRAGAPGGGEFIKKGEGQDLPNGSSRVLEMQQRLGELGIATKQDGKFGPQTEASVKAFQKKYGLKETGVVDAATVATMRNPPPLDVAQVKAADAAAAAGKGKGSRSKASRNRRGSGTGRSGGSSGTGTAAGTAGGGSSTSGRTSRSKAKSPTSNLVRRGDGMSGQPDPKVEALQQMLEDLGYDLGPGGVDGRFGEGTDAALRKFQQRAGLRVDGVAGAQTLAMLRRKKRQADAQNLADYGATGDIGGKTSARRRSVKEASYTGIGTTGGEMGTSVPYGGADPLLPGAPTVTLGDEVDPFDHGDGRTVPPGLREAGDQEWAGCHNCVHFNAKARCSLYEYPVDRYDICNSHLSLTPPQQQRFADYERAVTEVNEARAAGDGTALARAQARMEFHQRKLEEFGVWDPIKHPRGRGGKWREVMAAHYGHVKLSHAEHAYLDRNHDALQHHLGAKRYSNFGSRDHRMEEAEKSLEKKGVIKFSNHEGGVDRARYAHVHRALELERKKQMRRKIDKGETYSSRTRLDRTRAEARLQAQEATVEELSEVKSDAYPGLDRSPKKNWVDKAGGLPRYIERIAKHLHYEKGRDIGQSIAIAVNVVKKMCASGDTNFPGKQNVNAGSRAEACAAVAEWEKKKLQHGVMREAALRLEREPIPKGVGLGFAIRTLREVAEIDTAIAEGRYTPGV